VFKANPDFEALCQSLASLADEQRAATGEAKKKLPMRKQVFLGPQISNFPLRSSITGQNSAPLSKNVSHPSAVTTDFSPSPLAWQFAEVKLLFSVM
jgi:hypothetical protein